MARAAHGAWADARLLAAAGSAGGDITAVLRELAHVRGAQEIWLSRIEGRPATLPIWPRMTLSELPGVGTAVDAQLTQVLSSLTPSRRRRRRLHVCNARTGPFLPTPALYEGPQLNDGPSTGCL